MELDLESHFSNHKQFISMVHDSGFEFYDPLLNFFELHKEILSTLEER